MVTKKKSARRSGTNCPKKCTQAAERGGSYRWQQLADRVVGGMAAALIRWLLSKFLDQGWISKEFLKGVVMKCGGFL